MTADTSAGRGQDRLTMHLGPPGSRIEPAPGVRRWDYRNGNCQGDLRALYARDKTKRWYRAGWLCTRCGSVELHPGMVGVERSYWRQGTLPADVPYAGQLQPIGAVSTSAAAAAVVDTDAGDDETPVGRAIKGHIEMNDATVLHRPSTDGVDTETPAAGWNPLARVACPDCDKRIAASNLAKHRRRRHPAAVTA